MEEFVPGEAGQRIISDSLGGSGKIGLTAPRKWVFFMVPLHGPEDFVRKRLRFALAIVK